jgi:hypothetical protein
MTGLMNNELERIYMEGSRCGIIFGTTTAFAWREQENQVRIASLQAEF